MDSYLFSRIWEMNMILHNKSVHILLVGQFHW